MPSRPDPTAPQRTARYEDRMRRQGFVKKHVWVPANKVPEFQTMVARLRARYGGVDAPDLKRIVAHLRRHEMELRQAGIQHLGLFGSVARGEAAPETDVDLMLTFEPKAKIGLIEFTGLCRRMEEILKRPVVLVQEKSLKDYLRPQAMKDRVEVF